MINLPWIEIDKVVYENWFQETFFELTLPDFVLKFCLDTQVICRIHNLSWDFATFWGIAKFWVLIFMKIIN